MTSLKSVPSTSDFPHLAPHLSQAGKWRLLEPKVLDPGTLPGKTGIAITVVHKAQSVVLIMYTLLPKTMTVLEVPVTVLVLVVLKMTLLRAARRMVLGIVRNSQAPQIRAYLECDQSVQLDDPGALQPVFQPSLKSHELLVSELPP